MLRYNSFWHKAAYWLLLVLLAFILCRCYNERKAIQQVDKAILLQPKAAATELRKAFPCIIVQSDTTIVNQDTTILIDCPNEFFTVHDTTINNILTHDTVFNTRMVRVPVHLPIEVKTITKYIKDSAAETIIIQQTQQINDLKLSDAKHKGRGDKWFWIAMGLLVIIGVGIYLKIKKFALGVKD